jgi:hypothetical protein
VALPPNRGEALVGEISCVAVAVDEGLADGPLVGGGLRQAEGRYNTLRSDREADLEAVDPLGLRGAPSSRRSSRRWPVRRKAPSGMP